MAEILPIRRKTQIQSIDQSLVHLNLPVTFLVGPNFEAAIIWMKCHRYDMKHKSINQFNLKGYLNEYSEVLDFFTKLIQKSLTEIL